MIEVCKSWYSPALCRENPKKLFIFGDNLLGVGKGGQAIIRDEPNAYGISSKYDPGESYSDDRLLENIQHINSEVDILLRVKGDFDAIVFPAMGIGTGLAALQTRAPRTFLYLCKVLLDRFEFNNLAYLEPVKM